MTYTVWCCGWRFWWNSDFVQRCPKALKEERLQVEKIAGRLERNVRR